MSHPPHLLWFNHPNNIRWRIQAVKFIIMQFSLWSVFLPQSERPSFTPIQHNWQNYSFVYFNLQVFWCEEGRQKILVWMITSIPWI
jgi:hypothetical protein